MDSELRPGPDRTERLFDPNHLPAIRMLWDGWMDIPGFQKKELPDAMRYQTSKDPHSNVVMYEKLKKD
jgi:hypothetical protein